MNATTQPTIESIKIVQDVDTSPDTSWIGEYTDDASDWHIDVRTGEYLIDVRPGECNCGAEDRVNAANDAGEEHSLAEWEAMEAHADGCPAGREWEPARRGNNYRYFKPYAGGEKPSTDEYRKYGLQDFEYMERLNRGDACFYGITAVAEVHVDHGQYKRIHRIESGGLWGIESDSDRDYFEEVAREELANLKGELEAFNVDVSTFDELAETAIADME